MKLEEINEVFQTAEWQSVNKKLKEGFKIIRIFNGRAKTMETEVISPVFVLGKVE